jgi:hypothetical protein
MDMLMNENIINQLVKIYYTEEYWQKNLMSKEEAYRYHEKRYCDGNIICYIENEKVLGYYEAWRVNFEQWGRMVCHELIGFNEDVISGNICVVNNVWIDKDYRRGKVFKTLMRDFYKRHHNCDYYVGHALRKKTQPIKVFKKEDLKSNLFIKGE